MVVCLDEAQAMPLETLETLRLLTNLETEKRKLLQVVLFGQPELDDKLRQDSIRQLRQRITFQYHLGALTRDETRPLPVAPPAGCGLPRRAVFAPAAVARCIARAAACRGWSTSSPTRRCSRSSAKAAAGSSGATFAPPSATTTPAQRAGATGSAGSGWRPR